MASGDDHLVQSVVDDPELKAIATLVAVLEELTEAQRQRVIQFVFSRLELRKPDVSAGPLALPARDEEGHGTGREQFGAYVRRASSEPGADLRSLKEAKKPRSAVEMVTLLAYYHEHVAPERKNFISSEDLKPGFIQAGFKLPSGKASMTLAKAKYAGYLDQLERGLYRLNAVGYNLIAHKLPDDASGRAGRSAKARKSKQRARR